MEEQPHAGHPLGACVHHAACPVSADGAYQALTGEGKFFRAWEFCRPDTVLQFPGEGAGRTRAVEVSVPRRVHA
ncbi:hypothetical protein SAMN05428944_1740 [Streptomyces sp. 1222.5]|uniref:hypothetical protein n=1 Tax=unclassified Streptomyces TaxID=2593676 RepID=UPI0008999737|nr:hypothetical protein BX260_6352 [Streptomyces sp. 5112.2]SEB89416.1 hypothetical protein SAMN05428944_1740 [Streptomyces sp. 1222.5]